MSRSTVGEVLLKARSQLADGLESPGAAAQTLLTEVLGADRAYILAHPEQALTEEQAAAYDSLIARAAAGEPLPYILGRRPFWDRDLLVTPDVLIPRPETEHLLEQALRFSEARPSGVAIDVGTGSGALAVTFAAHRPDWHVYAVDVSPTALDVARRNADLHGVSARVTFKPGDLLSGISQQFDLMMANLPYIPSARLPSLAVSRSEPLLALDGGADGLDLIRRLLAQAPSLLKPGALMLLEIDYTQSRAVCALAEALMPGSQVDALNDLAGLDRIVRIVLRT
jgi:release factor glutamine methyltransferase